MNTYRTPFSLNYWRDACAELKSTRMLVLAALLVAVRVALKSLSIPVGESLYITVGFFVNAVGSMVYGPVLGFLSGIVCDLLGCLLFPKGPFFLPFTLIEGLGSLAYALFFYRARLSPTRIFAAKLTVYHGIPDPAHCEKPADFSAGGRAPDAFSGRYAAGAAPPGSAYRRTAGAEAHQTAYRGFGRDVPDCDRGGFGVLPLLLRCKITCRAVYGCVSLCKITLENDVFLC